MAQEETMAGTTMLYGECGGVLLCVHTADSPSMDEWEGYVEHCVRLPHAFNRTLVVTDGGGPNAAQRRLLQDRYLGPQKARCREYRVAVMTDSAFVRGIVKALNWFNPDANSFPYNDGAGVPLAIDHLKVDPRSGSLIRVELGVMRRELARLSGDVAPRVVRPERSAALDAARRSAVTPPPP
jgi:hypothetical protein